MSHKDFDIAVGRVLRKFMNKTDYNSKNLSRVLTIECLKLLPPTDRGDFYFTYEGKEKFSENAVELDQETINNYLNPNNRGSNSVIVINEEEGTSERNLGHSITPSMLDNYLSGRTPIPIIELMGLCRVFDIRYESFMNEVFEELNMQRKLVVSDDLSLEDAYNRFANKVFSDQHDNRYVYNTTVQNHLLPSLFVDGRDEVKLYFTYLPMSIGLKDKNKNTVIFQRGVLTFKKNNGMCRVTSNVEVGSQGISSQYEGFAIIMNPKSSGTTCTCFLREVGNTFGVFVLFTFRLSPLDKTPRKTRVSECMAVRRSDGTAFVYRLLISENYIDDDKMNYFVGHLKLCTSENTNESRELNIVIKKKYISIIKDFLSNSTKDKNSAIYSDLSRNFGDVNREHILKLIELIEESYTSCDEVLTISPDMFNKKNKEHLLFLGWLGKYGLSARHDKIENTLDDEVENLHKILYPELHEDMSDGWY